MLATELIQHLSNALFVAVFVLSLATAIRHPRRVNVELALLFGAAAVNITATEAFQLAHAREPAVVSAFSGSCALAIPYLLLRLVDDFAGVPFAIQRLAEVGLALSIAALIFGGTPAPTTITLLLIAYFAALTLYVTYVFTREARATLGVNARRMGAVAIGCGLLALAILIAGARIVFPAFDVPFGVLGGPLGLFSGLAFYLGFTTPQWLLRSWREPELLAFVSCLGELAERQDTPGLIRDLQAAVSATLGVRGTFVGLWNQAEDVLEYSATRITTLPSEILSPQITFTAELMRTPPDLLIGGMTFTTQRPIYSEAVDEIDPENAAFYRAMGVNAVVAAPMTVGDERFGVLGVFSPRRRLFGEDSLTRVQLLAHEAAIMLRSRALIADAARVKAHEELAQTKEDFLSAATHDLKTPLTAIKGVAQWAERRAKSNEPIDAHKLLGDLERIQEAAGRMSTMIDQVLDVSRLNMGRPLELTPTELDLMSLVRKVAHRHQEMTSRHQLRVEGPAQVEGRWDGQRLERAIDNLVGNAVKYSPQGGEVALTIRIERDGGCEQAVLDIRDHGIGLRARDVERVFDRFERGSNASERGITGTGIGLSYTREVVAAHGGRIAIDSDENQGSTFSVWLPLKIANGGPASANDSKKGTVDHG